MTYYDVCIFSIKHANEHGLHEAIVLYLLEQAIKYNSNNIDNIFDGKVWVCPHSEAWSRKFNFLSQFQIKNALDNLESRNILIKTLHNRSKFDNRAWYTFTSTN